MEPIKIELEVSLNDASIEKLVKGFAKALMEQTMGEVPSWLGSNDAPTAEVQPVEETAPAAAVEAEPAREITDSEVAAVTREAVAALKAKGESPARIKNEIFAKYGCTMSTGCAQEHRAAMIADLKAIYENA